jgi:regulator of cell morphogenesis and NO signaling
LADACGEKGLDANTVALMISATESNAAAGSGGATEQDWTTAPLSALIDNIVAVHHDYLREELPRLEFMTRKVAAVHGDHEPRLLQVRETFQAFAPEMIGHMHDEETAIFPRIRNLNTIATTDERTALHESIGDLEREHEEAGAALARFRELTDGYTPPEWACNTFRALYDSLARLEENMHQHVHKENNVLFPRALAGA